jgi:hypothetical protein
VPSQRRVEVGLLRGLLLFVCGVLLASSVYAAGTSAGWAPPFAVVCTASCVALTVALSPRGWLSGSSVYAAMFFAFHCGILLPLALGLPVPFLNEQDAQWADGPALRSAAGLAALAASALLLSQVLVGGRRAVSDRNQSPGPVNPPPLRQQLGHATDVRAMLEFLGSENADQTECLRLGQAPSRGTIARHLCNPLWRLSRT